MASRVLQIRTGILYNKAEKSMSHSRRNYGEGKGTLYRETLQATGCCMGRVVIAAKGSRRCSAPFAGLPGGLSPTAIGCVFGGITECIGPMWLDTQPETKPWDGTNRLPVVGPAAQVEKRVGRTTLSSSSAMSSGRLFRDRVGRNQSHLRFTDAIRINRLSDPRERFIIER